MNGDLIALPEAHYKFNLVLDETFSDHNDDLRVARER